MKAKKTRNPRPWWMINGAPEPLGDVGFDRYFHEWIRAQGSEEPAGEGDEPSRESRS